MLRLFLSFAVVVQIATATEPAEAYPYVAASPIYLGKWTFGLLPLQDDAVEVPVFPDAYIVYGDDGKTIYGWVPGTTGIFKLNLATYKRTLVPGTEMLGWKGLPFAQFTVSERHDLLVSFRRDFVEEKGCGLYSFSLSTGQPREIRRETPCRTQLSDLALSPDGKSMLAVERPGVAGGFQLDVVDLASGSIAPISPKYEHAQWAPNGQWVAAEETIAERNPTASRLVLLDPINFKFRRSLGEAPHRPKFAWSPDSRFLLIPKPQVSCSLYFPDVSSLQTIEVTTGRKAIIGSSRCRFGGGSVGWISAEVYRAALRAKAAK